MRTPRRTDIRNSASHRQLTRRKLVQRAATAAMATGSASMLSPSVPVAQGQSSTPASGTPFPGGESTISRVEHLAAIRQHFAIEPPQTRGGHILMAIEGEPLTLNPIVATDFVSGLVLGNLFSAIMQPSPIDGTWMPDLADSWEVSADGMECVYHLNAGARWHDGRPVTAHDCAFTFDAVLDEQSLSGIRSEVVKVVRRHRAVDDHAFELETTQPLALFRSRTVGSLPIVPRHIWESVPLAEWGAAPGATGADPSQVVGSGPFRFGSLVRGEHVSIVRNDDYWVPELVPSIDRFSWRVLAGADASLLALEAEETDISYVPVGRYSAIRDSLPHLTYVVYDNAGWANFTMNGDAERGTFFADPRVRQAMLYAVDRDLIVESVLDGFAVRADGIYPPPSRAYAPDRVTTIYNHDPERARALLDDAGWIVEDGDGIRKKDGVTFRAELLYPEAGPQASQVVPYLQEAWRDVGVDIQPAATAFQILLERLDMGDFDLALIGFGGFLDDMGLIYRCDAMPPHGFNAARICNPEFDRLNDLSLAEPDPVAWRELLIAQGNAANDIAHLGLLFFTKSILAHYPRVRNLIVGAHAPFPWLSLVWLADSD